MREADAQRLTIVKLDPMGRAVARYSGLRVPASPGWIAVIAEWTSGPVASGPLQFESGDRLFEYFSVVEPLNAFALYTADGRFKGWYANVSCPALFVEENCGGAIFISTLLLTRPATSQYLMRRSWNQAACRNEIRKATPVSSQPAIVC